jgi:hypothetical protein
MFTRIQFQTREANRMKILLVHSATPGGTVMLRIAVVVLLLLWALGLFTGRTMGGFVHVLLVLALVLGMISLVRGKNP